MFIIFTLGHGYHFLCTCIFYSIMHKSQDSTSGLGQGVAIPSSTQGPLRVDIISI